MAKAHRDVLDTPIHYLTCAMATLEDAALKRLPIRQNRKLLKILLNNCILLSAILKACRVYLDPSLSRASQL